MTCSHRRPTAPRSTASAAWACPSLFWPGTQQKRSPGTTRRLSWEMPPTSTVAGSPTDSITSMSSKRRFIGTVRMIDPTALHASGTPAGQPQQVCRRGSRDVLGLVCHLGGRSGGGGGLGSGGGGDVVAVQRVAHDLREHRCGHGAAEDRSRPVEDDDHGEGGVGGGREPDEGRHVGAGDVGVV